MMHMDKGMGLERQKQHIQALQSIKAFIIHLPAL